MISWGNLKALMDAAGVTDDMRIAVHGPNKYQYKVDAIGIEMTYFEEDERGDLNSNDEEWPNAVFIEPWYNGADTDFDVKAECEKLRQEAANMKIIRREQEEQFGPLAR